MLAQNCIANKLGAVPQDQFIELVTIQSNETYNLNLHAAYAVVIFQNVTTGRGEGFGIVAKTVYDVVTVHSHTDGRLTITRRDDRPYELMFTNTYSSGQSYSMRVFYLRD